MGVRPPTDDTSTDAVEFGIPVLAGRVDDAELEFPATEREVLDALDETAIPCDAAGHTVDLAEALRSVPSERFNSRTELLDELYPVFEREREHTSVSVLTRLRGLFPF